MRLLPLWLHVVGAAVWLGGLAYQAHVLMPAARRGGAAAFADAARRARPAAWTALALVVLTGFHNVTGLGPLERVMQSGAGVLLAGKFLLVVALVALAGHRDFAGVPRLARALREGEDPVPALRAIARLDGVILVVGVAVVYLGLAVSRR
jgi:putative copper export protein